MWASDGFIICVLGYWELTCQHPLKSRESEEISITTMFPGPLLQANDGLCQFLVRVLSSSHTHGREISTAGNMTQIASDEKIDSAEHTLCISLLAWFDF